MIVNRVQYTVNKEFAERNKENIQRVLDETRTLARNDIQYSVFLEPDGRTFTHMPVFGNESAQKAFMELEAFAAFRAALEASHPEVPPTTTKLKLVGTVGASVSTSEPLLSSEQISI